MSETEVNLEIILLRVKNIKNISVLIEKIRYNSFGSSMMS